MLIKYFPKTYRSLPLSKVLLFTLPYMVEKKRVLLINYVKIWDFYGQEFKAKYRVYLASFCLLFCFRFWLKTLNLVGGDRLELPISSV